jgi:hypothetical protein
MLCGRKRDVDIWRATPATSGTGNWGYIPGDPVYAYHHTSQMTIQPFEASDGFRNNERFSNVRQLLIAELTEDITDYDEVVIDNIHHKVAFVQPFSSSIIDHLEIYVAETQYDR